MVRLHPDALARNSKRGLVLAAPKSGALLLEHPRSSEFISYLSDDPTPDQLRERLGPPLQADLIEILIEDGILTEETTPEIEDRHTGVAFTRSGILFPGIARPSGWLARHLVPGITSWPGRLLLSCIVAAGAFALIRGRPDLPDVSSTPATEALLMLLIGLSLTICHELAHAVALSHYGLEPRRAGLGFYWGALSFYVDSTPALVLNRRQRVTQALVGLGVDLVTLSICAVLAHLSGSIVLAVVFWRLAVIGLVDVIINAMPILEVDGHWAMADLLDEPDLSPRARRALGLAVRGSKQDEPWLAWYGLFSLIGGIGLITASGFVVWATSAELIKALFSGNGAEIALGLYYVVPLTLGLVFSTVGLILETVVGEKPESGTTEHM